MRRRTPHGLTLAEAKAACAELGCVLAKKDGEYRVNFKGGREATAYYTTDLEDAVGTAKAMIADLQRIGN